MQDRFTRLSEAAAVNRRCKTLPDKSKSNQKGVIRVLNKIKVVLEECEKRGYELNVRLFSFNAVDGSKVSRSDARVFLQHLVGVLGGRIDERETTVDWNDESGDFTFTFFHEKPTVSVPTDEWRKTMEELERLRAEKASSSVQVD